MLRATLAATPAPATAYEREIIVRLSAAIAEFIVALNRGSMSVRSAQRLPQLLRAAIHYERVSELAIEAREIAATRLGYDHPSEKARAFYAAAIALLDHSDPASKHAARADAKAASAAMEEAYEALKAELLADGSAGRISVGEMDGSLRAASALRRAVQQAAEAFAILDGTRRGT